MLFFPSEAPKKTLCVSGYLSIGILAAIPLISYVPSYSKLILALCMLSAGFLRSYMIVINVIMAENIDA